MNSRDLQAIVDSVVEKLQARDSSTAGSSEARLHPTIGRSEVQSILAFTSPEEATNFHPPRL